VFIGTDNGSVLIYNLEQRALSTTRVEAEAVLGKAAVKDESVAVVGAFISGVRY